MSLNKITYFLPSAFPKGGLSALRLDDVFTAPGGDGAVTPSDLLRRVGPLLSRALPFLSHPRDYAMLNLLLLTDPGPSPPDGDVDRVDWDLAKSIHRAYLTLINRWPTCLERQGSSLENVACDFRRVNSYGRSNGPDFLPRSPTGSKAPPWPEETLSQTHAATGIRSEDDLAECMAVLRTMAKFFSCFVAANVPSHGRHTSLA